MYGLPRTTLDVDLFVRPTRSNVGGLIAALGEIGFGIARELDPRDVLDKHLFQFADQIRIDIFMRPWGLTDFEECWARRSEIEFESVTIPFVGIRDLILSKETDREQDRADRVALEEIARRLDQKGGN